MIDFFSNEAAFRRICVNKFNENCRTEKPGRQGALDSTHAGARISGPSIFPTLSVGFRHSLNEYEKKTKSNQIARKDLFLNPKYYSVFASEKKGLHI